MGEFSECPSCYGELETEFDGRFGRIFKCQACGLVIPVESKEAVAEWNERGAE